MEHLVPIGQFSQLTWLSPKALRRYADSGLLPPARIDPDTGYRYYRLAQVERARMIRLLRATDMSLAAIATFLEAPSPEGLAAHERALATKQAEREQVLRYLYRIFSHPEVDMASPSCSSDAIFLVKLKEVPAQAFVSRSATVSLGQLPGYIAESIRGLAAEQTPAGRPFSLFHGPINDETDGPVEVCVPVARRLADGGELPAGPVAYTVVEGTQTEVPEIMAAFDAVAVWAKQQGHELDGAPREIYLTDLDGPETPRWEVAWPVR